MSYTIICGIICATKKDDANGKYTLEQIQCEEMYNIESDVFVATYDMVKWFKHLKILKQYT